MTYRERRERKAEKLREWAEKREAKSVAELASAHRIADGIPLGQPVLVGHHSEKRHRRDLNRIDNAMHKGFENADKAHDMRDTATEIERQLDRSIYDDDPDAIERLTEKLASMEAKRDAMKERNSIYRKAHRDELKTMTAYERSQAVPHPSYELQNLGGNIKRCRDRIASLRDPRQRWRQISVKYTGACNTCNRTIEQAETAFYCKAEHSLRCPDCLGPVTPM